MEETLSVELRETLGKHRARRLRRSGAIPAVVYGRGKKPVPISVARDALQTALRHGSLLVQLKGAETGIALIQALHWDAFGNEVLHIDSSRAAADQQIEVAVAVELRGDAPGVRDGGVLEQVLREVELRVRATEIPDRLHLNVNALGVGQSMTAAEIEDLLAGAKLLSDPTTVMVHCVVPVAEVAEAPMPEGAEPELIGGQAPGEAADGPA